MSPKAPFDLATATHDLMEPLVGGVFTLQLAEGQSMDLTLIEAKKLGAARPGQRAAFSLLFRPADPVFYAPQQIHTLRHSQLGRLEVFLVPIRPDATGARFEAVFN